MRSMTSTDQTEKVQAAVVNRDGALKGLSHPDPAGSIVSVHAAGEGQTSPGVDGKLAQIHMAGYERKD